MTLFRLLGGLVAGACSTMAAANASASPIDLDIVPRAIVLQGARGTTNFVFRLPLSAQGSRPPRLALDWSLSELVRASRSSLSVHIDGKVVSTFRLGHDDSQPVGKRRLIDLGPLALGPHRLELTSRLNVDGDPCLKRHQDDAWLKILPSTRISFVPSQHGDSEQLSLARLPSALRGAAADSWVQIVPPAQLTQDAARAVVEAHHLLKSWNVKVALLPAAMTSNTARPQVILGFLQEPLAKNLQTTFRGPLQQLRSAPAEVIGVVAIVGQQLAVVARQDVHLADMVRQLSLASVRQLCPQHAACLLSRSTPITPQVTAPEPDKATVLRLADFGYRLGWTAKGAGSHSLRFVWNRPASWKLTTPPRLQLNLRLPPGSLLDRSRTHVSVVLNERPLASWALNASGNTQQLLQVKIPIEHWKEASWAFEVAIYLAPQSGLPCESVDNDAVWAVLGPESHISVNRHEPQYRGLASFYHKAQNHRPTVHWRPLKTWAQVLQLSEVLYPFSLLTPSSMWDFEQIPKPSPKAAIIELQPPWVDERLASTSLGSKQILHDASQTLGLPVLHAETATVLSHHDATAQHPEELRVHLGHSALAHCPSPQYSGLLGRYAVCVAKLWVGLGQEKHPTQTLDVQRRPSESALALEKLRSDEERSLRWVNLVWTALSLLSLMAIGLYAWRRPRRPYSPVENLEISEDPLDSPTPTKDQPGD